ncbi:hypothetical protein QBC47DRAFT_348022 [Echria macrotheca]|uniref:Duf1665 domain containing protein n=1 Tax=Echria macrotheca TaxID=438768 RepID=A0AAJ0B9D0_9PEZI|nr:hypothetical protein QBC47DRAFT_348022 [Echria macrotheca]
MASTAKNEFPGLGLPVEHDKTALLPLAIDGGWLSWGITLREMRMLDFINQITDKPGWEHKVFDEAIVSRWRAEADARPLVDGDPYLSKPMFDFCIAELRDKSEHSKLTGRVAVLDAEFSVVKSDSAVSRELRDELKAGVIALENVPDRKKDWHPGSDETVLDIVHPSLFPVIWGLTRALPEGTVPLKDCIKHTGKGVAVDSYRHPSDCTSTSQTHLAGPCRRSADGLWGSFQWLPAQVQVSADGSAKITSYINNLYPEHHKNLYSTLERIVAATVPLWEDCLNGLVRRPRIEISETGEDDYTYPPGAKYHIPGREGKLNSIWDPLTDDYDNSGIGEDAMDDDRSDDSGGYEFEWKWEAEFHDWKTENRILIQREPRVYTPQAELLRMPSQDISLVRLNPEKPFNLREKFPAGIQVIFKLANILLTPEKPTYSGGSWHVEGTLNERICASAIYYYDQDNITDSHLAFRQAVDVEEVTMIPEQNNFDSLEAYLGVRNEEAAVQRLGQVLTREGRLLVFPNCAQHQVQPFELVDKTKPGHRKILAMFLIDPYRPILSSAHVPPQRRDWWADEVRRQGGLDRLPAELFDLTVNMVDDFPISWQQAVEFRERLMDERSGMNEVIDNQFNEALFSFCEH